MRGKAVLLFIALTLTMSNYSYAMSNKTTIEPNSVGTQIDFKKLNSATKVQSALQKAYPNGTNLDDIVNDLKLNKKSEIHDHQYGNIILYHLYDGSKNINGYNYWKVSITVNSKNQIEQISVNDGDYQGS